MDNERDEADDQATARRKRTAVAVGERDGRRRARRGRRDRHLGDGGEQRHGRLRSVERGDVGRGRHARRSRHARRAGRRRVRASSTSRFADRRDEADGKSVVAPLLRGAAERGRRLDHRRAAAACACCCARTRGTSWCASTATVKAGRDSPRDVDRLHDARLHDAGYLTATEAASSTHASSAGPLS